MLPERKGGTAMIGPWLTRKRLALLAAVALVAGGTALLSLTSVYPKTVSSGILGEEWQCRRIAFLVTCTRLDAEPGAHGLGRRLLAGRPV
jgi:hypothetical protein